MTKLLMAVIALISFTQAGAVGVFVLKGQLKGFDETAVRIQKMDSIYEVKKSELAPAILTQLKQKKTGDTVEFPVTTTAVLSVTPVKATKTK